MLYEALPLSKNLAVLREPLAVQGHIIPNRLAIQPMEGCDGTPDGSPGDLTFKRYERFAKSGAGLLWVEATAVQEDGRSNPRQLWLHEKNLDSFKALAAQIRKTAQKERGIMPLLILQATHSGRYSKPLGQPAPLIACSNPLFEKDKPLPPERILTDGAIRAIETHYAETARLAQEAGFDGIDVKACHRYLCSELFSAFTRPGPYGGSFENRTRFFRNAVGAARSAATGNFIVTSRMNIYDGFPRPYGFGMKDDGSLAPDLAEPMALIEQLKFPLLNITMGNPYVNPQVNRPQDTEAVQRMYALTGQVQLRFPDMPIISSAPSFLKEESPYLAAGAVESRRCAMVGFGRMAFAYPEFAADMLADCLQPKKVCLACGKCSELMRAGSVTGCVLRDAYYTGLYREKVQHGY